MQINVSMNFSSPFSLKQNIDGKEIDKVVATLSATVNNNGLTSVIGANIIDKATIFASEDNINTFKAAKEQFKIEIDKKIDEMLLNA